MIVDQLIDWLPTSESWPGLTFIFVVIVNRREYFLWILFMFFLCVCFVAACESVLNFFTHFV